jgi:phage terminase large subunit-like protein
MFPAVGPYRRELYAKHLQFFAAGGRHTPFPSCPEGCTGEPHRERCFMAANRVGKTEAGAYETVLHLTGLYPDWWTGKRFDRPIRSWACGDTNKTVREIVQEKLLGPVNAVGTGMIPGDLIVHRTTKPGIAESVDTVYVRHVTGGMSSVTLKSYQEGRESFQGAAVDWLHMDEEPPESIYTEALMRTMTTGGSLILTFTPLLGMSAVVMSYLPDGQLPG